MKRSIIRAKTLFPVRGCRARKVKRWEPGLLPGLLRESSNTEIFSNCQQVALRAFLAIAASWAVKTADIKSLFFRASSWTERSFYRRPRQQQLLQAKYGDCDIAYLDWRTRPGNSFRASWRQFWHWIANSVSLILRCSAVAGMAVLLAWSQVILTTFFTKERALFDQLVMNKLRQRFFSGKLKETNFRYVGFYIDQRRHGVTLDQTEYVNGLDPVDINSQRVCQEDTLTTKEQIQLRGMVGRLNWVVQGSRPHAVFDMVELSMRFKKGRVGDLRRAAVCQIWNPFPLAKSWARHWRSSNSVRDAGRSRHRYRCLLTLMEH